MTERAAFPPGEAREDWAILRALSDRLGHACPSIRSPSCAPALYAAHPHFMRIDQIAPGSLDDVTALAARGGHGRQRAVRATRSAIST